MSTNFQEILTKLKQPIPKNLVKQREGWTDYSGRKHMVDYIEWHTAADILDNFAPEWSYRIVNTDIIGEIIVVTASISISGVQREGVGTGDARKGETGFKKAESDALKRAAVKFGIARELYQHDEDTFEEEPTTTTRTQSQRPNTPSSPSRSQTQDKLTSKQRDMIIRICNDRGDDPYSYVREYFKVELDALTKKEASSVIDELMN